MDHLSLALSDYPEFMAREISDRFFKHSDIIKLLERSTADDIFSVEEVGRSFQGRSINLVKCGTGPVKVFLWSQMHGDEATATMALFDLFSLLHQKNKYAIAETILGNCTLYILPMVNPDGSEIFERRNAQLIDINRDFRAQQSPEGRILRALRDKIKPTFGFNLHDQNDEWSAGMSGNPAAISLLAPAGDNLSGMNTVREAAAKVIADMSRSLEELAPGHIGRWSEDDFEPRAFGDNFQAHGTSTILIEAGRLPDDTEKQIVRKHYFTAMLAGLLSISTRSYKHRSIEEYFAIPPNLKRHTHLMLKNCSLAIAGQSFRADLSLFADHSLNPDGRSLSLTYKLRDLGDLKDFFGYRTLDCKDCEVIIGETFQIDSPIDIIVKCGESVLLSIEAGVLKQNRL